LRRFAEARLILNLSVAEALLILNLSDTYLTSGTTFASLPVEVYSCWAETDVDPVCQI